MSWLCIDLCYCWRAYYSDTNRNLRDECLEIGQSKNGALIDDKSNMKYDTLINDKSKYDTLINDKSKYDTLINDKSNQDIRQIHDNTLLDDIVTSMSESS